MATALPAVPSKPGKATKVSHSVPGSRKPSSVYPGGARTASGSRHIDVIDKLDLTGLAVSFHHSGPFDAARAKSAAPRGKPAPIAAFSSAALDPERAMVSSIGADLPLLRDAGTPQNRYGGNTGSGSGISARAKAAMNATQMFGEADGEHPSVSLENLLPVSPSSVSTTTTAKQWHSRRNSDSSVVLGFPAGHQRLTEKERQFAEAFGVHDEAYEDYGRSGWAKKQPRASIFASAESVQTALSFGGEGGLRAPGALSREARADRTASIWDIEATLRAGRPVGASSSASTLPAMPVLPAQYLQASSSSNEKVPLAELVSSPSSPPNVARPEMKRKKSLMDRMRDRTIANSSKSAQASPDTSANVDWLYSPSASPHRTRYVQPMSTSANNSPRQQTHTYVTRSARPSIDSSIPNFPPGMTTRSLLQPVHSNGRTHNVMEAGAPPTPTKSPRRLAADVASPLNPPEMMPGQPFYTHSLTRANSINSPGRLGLGISRSQKYGDLASESSTSVSRIAESDSRGSNKLTSLSSSGSSDGLARGVIENYLNESIETRPTVANISPMLTYNGRPSYDYLRSSSRATGTPDTSFASSYVVTTPDAEWDKGDSFYDSSPNPAGEDGNGVRRKPSLARRLLGKGKKKST